ncbi:hypothetical protein COCOBI_pt-2150 (chloroplast) [Coccomyxa sp. Obi]|nr:hypothetical protein COCOBI_pt-2150 [Coccomyxa sp. Obi]
MAFGAPSSPLGFVGHPFDETPNTCEAFVGQGRPSSPRPSRGQGPQRPARGQQSERAVGTEPESLILFL